jgi:protein TonB
VQERIANTIEYPDEAREYGWEGTVKLSLLILNDGTLASSLVRESSGHETLDQAALQTAQAVAPYPDFPSESDLQELNVTVPVTFSLDQED